MERKMSVMDGPAAFAAAAPPARQHQASPEVALMGIYEISKILSGPTRLEQTLANVVNVLSCFFDMRLGMIVILDADGEPEIIATAGWATEAKGKPIETLPRVVIDRLVATSTAVVAEDITKDPLFAKAADLITRRLDGRISFLGVPIKSDERVIGTLSINRVWDGERASGFDDDLHFLRMVANLVGQTVRLHRMLSAERKRFLDEKRSLEKALDGQLIDSRRSPAPKVNGIVGESAAIRKVLTTIEVVAKSNSTVLLRGESGTGKELFARAVHDLSPRKSQAVRQAQLRGAAGKRARIRIVRPREGRLHRRGRRSARAASKLAHGGTLLLDEIGEISPTFQAKLLRVLQEGEFERVGGTRTLKVDVRLICATNRNLEAGGREGRVPRRPLLPHQRDSDVSAAAARTSRRHRAAGARLPRPLQRRERTAKLAIVGRRDGCAEALLFPRQHPRTRELRATDGDAGARRSHHARRLSCAAGDCLSALLWTGSGRGAFGDPIGELASGRTIVAPTSSGRRRRKRASRTANSPKPSPPTQACARAETGDCPAIAPRLTEKDRLLEAMERAGWVQAKAARVLGITPRQIGYALRKHRIEMKHF